MRRRRLLTLILPLAAAPAVVATIGEDRETVFSVTVAPALACTGLTTIPAIPNETYDQDGSRRTPLVALNSRVILYESSSMLTKKPQPEDDLVLVEGGPGDGGTYSGIQVPVQRRELFPSLIEVVPISPLKAGTEYSLIWNEKGYAQPRAQAHFNVSDRRDEKSPKIETIGPVTIDGPPEARTSCDLGLKKMTLPFAYEDESPVVVGIWAGAVANVAGEPLGYSGVWNKQVSVLLRDGSPLPSAITLVAFDSAGHRSAPCSISVDSDQQAAANAKRGCGCGKSGTPKREVKNCSQRTSAGK